MPLPLVRIALFAGAVLLVGAALLPPSRRGKPKLTAPLPSAAPIIEYRTREGFVLADATELKARMGRSRAKAIVVNAWASWCGSCKQELPVLLALGKTFDATSVEVFLVSVDDSEGLPLAAEMLSAFGATSRGFVAKGSLEEFKHAMNPKWPGMIPATFLFDRRGTLHYFWGGPVLEEELVPLLRRYLAGENVDGESNFALAPGATEQR